MSTVSQMEESDWVLITGLRLRLQLSSHVLVNDLISQHWLRDLHKFSKALWISGSLSWGWGNTRVCCESRDTVVKYKCLKQQDNRARQGTGVQTAWKEARARATAQGAVGTFPPAPTHSWWVSQIKVLSKWTQAEGRRRKHYCGSSVEPTVCMNAWPYGSCVQPQSPVEWPLGTEPTMGLVPCR